MVILEVGLAAEGGRKNHYCCRCCHLTGNSVIRMKTFQFNQKPSVANLAIETKHCNCDMMTFFENKSENSEKISEKSKHRVKEFIYI